eukprot:TRINITY_DN1900_c0_g2_i8.p1 TRINITY_DN1900_c0_g2~~TRINITY_DN1900_c0_g2_i8.p1  ORF type:complete len:178 (-),score=41.10 TRINITY_DN1900_c0_g2_i8:41-574(-)
MVSSQAFLLYYGFVPQTNEVDFITIPFLTPDYFNSVGAPIPNAATVFQSHLIQPMNGNQNQTFRLAVFNSLLNMNPEEKAECAQQMAALNSSVPLDDFMQACPEKEWTVSIFPNITSYINEQITVANSVTRKLYQYKSTVPKERAYFVNMLLSYYKGRIILCKKVLNGINSLLELYK